jgi:hypothetical protein
MVLFYQQIFVSIVEYWQPFSTYHDNHFGNYDTITHVW